MEDYKKGINYTFNFIKVFPEDKANEFKINHYLIIRENIDESVEKISSWKIAEDNKNKMISYNTQFRFILNDVFQLHIYIVRFFKKDICPYTDDEGRHKYFAGLLNKIRVLEIKIHTLTKDLKRFSLFIKDLKITERFKEALRCKEYFLNMFDYYVRLLLDSGIDLSKSPLFPFFEDSRNDLENSITIKEVELYISLNGSKVSEISVNNIIENIDAETNIDIDLLKYLSDNFKGGKTLLTKYNQIYRYFNEKRGVNIPQMAYKNLIKELFHFDYGNSDITREIKKHLITLKNLAIHYRDIKK